MIVGADSDANTEIKFKRFCAHAHWLTNGYIVFLGDKFASFLLKIALWKATFKIGLYVGSGNAMI